MSGKCAMASRSVFSTSMIEDQDYVVLFLDGHVLLDIELVFPGFGNLFCRGYVHERCFQGLRGYGLIIFRRRLS